MSDRFIQYEINKFCSDKEPEIKTISFEHLKQHSACIDWQLISDNVTEETCTKEFYDIFNDYLQWNNSNFIAYVDEKDLYDNDRIEKISLYHLFRAKPDLSEKFCRYVIELYNKNNGCRYHYYNTAYREILTHNINLSTEFIEETFKKLLTDEVPSYEKESYVNVLARNQKITEEQYSDYVECRELRGYFRKFIKFIVLSNPKNNYSIDFIKSHRLDMNQRAFFNTEQVMEFISKNPISKNALEVFKTKINYIDLLNTHALGEEILDNMVSVCKKELFDTLIKNGDQLHNDNNLNYLKSIL